MLQYKEIRTGERNAARERERSRSRRNNGMQFIHTSDDPRVSDFLWQGEYSINDGLATHDQLSVLINHRIVPGIVLPI